MLTRALAMPLLLFALLVGTRADAATDTTVVDTVASTPAPQVVTGWSTEHFTPVAEPSEPQGPRDEPGGFRVRGPRPGA